jgi:L-fuconolactonase
LRPHGLEQKEVMDFDIVDAHQHFWELGRLEYSWMTPERSALRRSFLPEDLIPKLTESGIGRTVVVQAHPSLDETRWLLELASIHEFIGGVVGWVDLAGPEVGKQLDVFQTHPKFKGVRHPLEAEADDAWMVRQEVVAGLNELTRRDIPYDLVVYPRHLKHIPELRERCPGLRLVVDHLAKPQIAEAKMDQWAAEMRIVSSLPDVWCKVSGLITEADWSKWKVDQLRPYVQLVVSAFGFDRLMFGSDWPVCNLAGSFRAVVNSTRETLGPLSKSDAQKFWGGNASWFYRLS